MPQIGMIKCNVHTIFRKMAFQNGNRSSIGLIFRNSRGLILHMMVGSLEFGYRKGNEFRAFLEGLKEAYYKDYANIILETHLIDTLWE